MVSIEKASSFRSRWIELFDHVPFGDMAQWGSPLLSGLNSIQYEYSAQHHFWLGLHGQESAMFIVIGSLLTHVGSTHFISKHSPHDK